MRQFIVTHFARVLPQPLIGVRSVVSLRKSESAVCARVRVGVWPKVNLSCSVGDLESSSAYAWSGGRVVDKS